MKPSDEALSAATNYLKGTGVSEKTYPTRIRKNGKVITTTWNTVLTETAEAVEEEGLVEQYLDTGPKTRSGRKKKAYRQTP